MKGEIIMEYIDYQLRYAAGMYWLLNIKQRGFKYIKPLPLNECGAHIWKMLSEGLDEAAIADIICKEYDIGMDEAMNDIKAFLSQLRQYIHI